MIFPIGKRIAGLTIAALVPVIMLGCTQSVSYDGAWNQDGYAITVAKGISAGDGSNEIVEHIEYEYDDAGNMIAENDLVEDELYKYEFNHNGEPTIYSNMRVSPEIKYDSDGRIAAFEARDGEDDDKGVEVTTYEFKYDESGNIIETLEQWDAYDVGSFREGKIAQCVRTVVRFNSEGYPVTEMLQEVHWDGAADSDKRLQHDPESATYVGRYEGENLGGYGIICNYDYSYSDNELIGISKTYRYNNGSVRDAGDGVSTYDVVDKGDSSIEVSGGGVIQQYTFKAVHARSDFAKAFNKLKRFIIDLG